MSKYTIIGRQREGTIITGYILRDNATGRVGLMDKNKVYRLALNKQISDVIAQEYNGKVTMKGTKYKINSLPCYDSDGNRIEQEAKPVTPKRRLLLTGKQTDGKTVVAYRVAVIENGQLVKQTILERAKVMELAKQGLIENARYQSSNGADILRGVNCKLSSLENISNYAYV